MTASEQALDEAAAVYAAILDYPQRAVEIRAARERYATEQAARAEQTSEKEEEGAKE